MDHLNFVFVPNKPIPTQRPPTVLAIAVLNVHPQGMMSVVNNIKIKHTSKAEATSTRAISKSQFTLSTLGFADHET